MGKITFIRGRNNFVPFDESLVNREKVGYLLTWSRFGSSEVEAASVSIRNSGGVLAPLPARAPLPIYYIILYNSLYTRLCTRLLTTRVRVKFRRLLDRQIGLPDFQEIVLRNGDFTRRPVGCAKR